MSLINQMLKDLEARHEGDARSRLHREVRPLPVAQEHRVLRIAVLGTVLTLVAGGGVWLFLNRPPALQTSTPAAAPQSAPQAVPSVIPQNPVPAPAEAATPAPLAAAAAAPQSGQSGQSGQPSAEEPSGVVDGLKMSASLDHLPPMLPKMATATAPTPMPASVPAAEKKVTPAARPPEVLAPAGERLSVDSTGKSRGIGAVEKSTPAASPRERSEAAYRGAVSLVNAGRVNEGVDALLDILRQDGNHSGARQLVAKLLIEQRRLDEAMAILAEGLASHPAQLGWAMTLARLQVDRGDLAGAGRTLATAQPYGVASADYQGFAGLVQYRLGNQRESAEHYQNAARLAPGDGRWWLGLGLALEAGQRSAEAREAFVRARATGTLGSDLAALVDQKLR